MPLSRELGLSICVLTFEFERLCISLWKVNFQLPASRQMFVGPDHHTSPDDVTDVSSETLLLKTYSLPVLGLIELNCRVLYFDRKIYELRLPT